LGFGSGARLELELEGIVAAHQTMGTADQPNTISLQSVTQLRLSDAFAPFQLVHQQIKTQPVIVIHCLGMHPYDSCQQQPTEARGRLEWENRIANNHPTGRRHRTGMPHPEFRQDHLANLQRHRAQHP